MPFGMSVIFPHSEMSGQSEMNIIAKRTRHLSYRKEGAVSFENERDGINLQKKSMINLYMISFLNDGHFFISKRGAYGERL